MEFPRLKITSSTDLSIGEAKTNVVGMIVQHAYTNESGGLNVPTDLKWWLDAAAFDAGKDQIWPSVSGVKVSSTYFELSQAQALAANLPITMYSAAASAIMVAYPSLTVTVELS